LIVAASLAAFAGLARAQEGDPGRGFGLGVMAGEPTGINGKLWSSGKNAFVGGAAWSFTEDGSFSFYTDYVFHQFDWLTVEKGRLPVYLGIGGRLLFRDDEDDLFGARMPVGLDYLFADAPVDVFAEVVPILDLTPETKFRLNGAIGGRFFF
jgi:hypothetical protein